MDDRIYLIVDRGNGRVLAECDSLERAQSLYLQFKAYASQTGAELELTSRAVDNQPPAAGAEPGSQAPPA